MTTLSDNRATSTMSDQNRASSAQPVTLAPALDHRRIRMAMDRAALSDPQSAGKRFLADVGAMLVERLEFIRIEPDRILDLGDRSGTVHHLLRQRFPDAKILSSSPTSGTACGLARLDTPNGAALRLGADATRLPFPDHSFSLILSNMALHWTSPLPTVLREMRRLLTDDGLLLFTTIGDGTLAELRDVCDQVDRERSGSARPRILTGYDLHQLGDLLQAESFAVPVVDREQIRPLWSSLQALLETLKEAGSLSTYRPTDRGLSGPGLLRRMDQLYRERHGTPEGDLPSTVEILFGHAWNNDPLPSSPLPNI
ncbi:MAG: methyltransferase domain-containing protein [Magnetococcales bacterium]|nr:methyltransferase domain-containing protein [Magnetococcales bacterium]